MGFFGRLSSAARVPSVDPSLTTMISRGALNSMVNSRSITDATVPASLKTGTMMETSARGTSVNRSEFYVNGGSSSAFSPVFGPIGQPRSQHRQGSVDDDHNHQPADRIDRQRCDDVGGEQDAWNASDGEAEGRREAVAALSDESQAPDWHQEGAGAHHDRKRGGGIHAEQADQDHARRVEPDPERHQGAEQEVYRDADEQLDPAHAKRVAAAGEEVQLGHQHQRRSAEERSAHADLHPAPGPVRHDTGTEPRTKDRGEDEREQRQHVH